MRRWQFIVTAACVTWGIFSIANADAYIIDLVCTDTGSPVVVGKLDVLRTPSAYVGSTTLDRVDVYLRDWLTMSDSNTINTIDGMFSAINPATQGFALYEGTGTQWRSRTALYLDEVLEDYTNRPAPQSYATLISIIDGATWTRTENTTLAAPATGFKMYSQFDGGWFTGDTNYNIGIDDKIFTLYLTSTTQFEFHGSGAPDGISTTGGSFKNFAAYSAVPEPSSLFLLASGLIGLVAYGWRKRARS
jgi:hypothetical protein